MIDIPAIKARADKATSEPWFVHDFADVAVSSAPSANDVTVSCDHPATITVAFMGGGLEGSLGDAGIEQGRKDADFIAHARTDIPDLIAALEAAERERDACAGLASQAVSDMATAQKRITALEQERDTLKAALKMPDADRRQWLLSELVATKGYFNRIDLCEAFGISIPQASTDIRRFLTAFPGLVEYDKTAKRYARRALESKP